MVRRTWWLCCMCGSKEWEDDMNFSRVYVWLGRRGGERPPVKRVRCLCVFVGGWPQQAGDWFVYVTGGSALFNGRRTNEIDMYLQPHVLDCRYNLYSIHTAGPSSTIININKHTSNNTLHHIILYARWHRSLSRDSFRVSFSPKNNNTFNYFRRNNIILPTPTFPPRIEIINSRLNTAGGQFFHRLCCRCTRFAGPIVSSSAFECLQYWLLVLYLWSIPYTM